MSDGATHSDGVHTWLVSHLWAAAAGIAPDTVDVSDLPGLDEVVWERSMTTLEFVGHVGRAMAADMGRPIIIGPDGRIVDGYHRAARALIEGRATIQAVRLAAMPHPIATRVDDIWRCDKCEGQHIGPYPATLGGLHYAGGGQWCSGMYRPRSPDQTCAQSTDGVA